MTETDSAVDDFHAQLARGSWKRRLPMFRQTELAECGHACIAMIANYFGHEVDLTYVRTSYPPSVRGSRLSRIIEIAEKLGLQSRAIRVELDQVRSLSGPTILHWDESHFVVLKEVSGKKFVIHDPSHGIRQIGEEELSRHFTGVALEVRPGPAFSVSRAKIDRISLRSLFSDVTGLVPALSYIAVLAVALEATTITAPFLLQWVIDQVIVAGDRDLLVVLASGFCALVLFSSGVAAARSWAVATLGAAISVHWAVNLFRHLMKLPLSWFDRRQVGDVVFRFSSLQTIQRTMTTQFVATMLDGLMSVAVLLVLVIYNINLAMLVAIVFACYTVLRTTLFAHLRSAGERQIVMGARQQTALLESIRGAMTIKIGNAQGERAAKYANASVNAANSDISVQKLSILFTLGDQLIFGVGRVATIYLAAISVLDTRMSTGMLVAFMAYADMFSNRSAALVDRLVDVRMLRLHAERVADIAHAETEANFQGKGGAPKNTATLELVNISYRYGPDEPWILKDLSILIEAGESLAITGPSGCGKTTLAKIILGLLQPSEGAVYLDGKDIRSIGLESYRNIIGAVMQDDTLFAGTIAENIALFNADFDHASIQAAARIACIHDEILLLPLGYQTLVGDMGSTLSGGQRQRIMLARALVRGPSILVLDEATSHLDGMRERAINAAIRSSSATRILIAHRLETIQSADRIVTLGRTI